MSQQFKQHYTIGCCGIDCGLCPRYISKSDSSCPGCGGIDFNKKHPSCGFLTCCVKKHGFEVCAECEEYPCNRFNSEREGYDSFVSHRKLFQNQELIRSIGIDPFILEQRSRIEILNYFIQHFDNGRSKSYFCQTCTLLPTNILKEILQESKQIDNSIDIKERNSMLRELIQEISDELGIDLKLRKK